MASPTTIFLTATLLLLATSALAQEPAAQNPTLATNPPEQKAEAPGPTVVSTAANPQNAALLAFKREQAALWKEELKLFPLPDYVKALEVTEARADAVETAKGDAALDYAPLQERAYFAANDGSPQPYYVMLPDGYTEAKKWPMVVFLHGYSTLVSKINPWIPTSDILEAAAKRGFIFVIPYGRRNSDFVDWGEDDTRAVRDEVMRHYSVDPDRVTLLGASMGAFGAYAVGLHRPGDWAAVAPISGRTDMFLWFKTSHQSLPEWKNVLLEADDPRTLILNARNTPFFIQHGALDTTVPVEHARRYVDDSLAFGLPVRYIEDPRADHETMFGLPTFERAFDWLQTRSAGEPPHQFTFTTGNGLEDRAYWGRIETFADYSHTARLDVKAEGNAIQVKTKNVARFVLEPPHAWWKAGQKIALLVNGTPAGDFDSQQLIDWQTPGAKIDKFPGHVGPFKNLLRAPFLLVYGNDQDAEDATHFASEWQDWTDGEASLKAAANITDADKAKFNLVLFGTRATNPLLGQISDQLPLELTPGGYRIGPKQIEAQNMGLRMVWKSPWNAKRLIGVCSGLWWGEKLPLNHKWDWIPDYIVYGEETEPDPDDTNHAVEAGWFDGNWNLVNQGTAPAALGVVNAPMTKPNSNGERKLSTTK